LYKKGNSTEEEEEIYMEGTSASGQHNILGLPGVQQPSMSMLAVNMDSKEDMDLNEDHNCCCNDVPTHC
jgi:hypothetical protein